MDQPKRKLIEVALPLEAINKESAREKSIRHGHPSTLHLWWARRPLAAARAVLFAQLVDDPSSHPDKFPTEEAQKAERERLHRLIERLVVWENVRDQSLLNEAHEEILASTNGNPPPILDPFAGGGTIPLEAQRLGLEAHASDLNPVAVLINKALIEIPPKFAGREPVSPGLAGERTSWEGATGLAADVRAYGEWMRDEAEKRIGRHYPKAKLDDGTEATVIAWIWARTVTCPNPACGIEMPLVRSWWLGKKKGKEAWVRPVIVVNSDHPSGKRVKFEIGTGPEGPLKEDDGTMSGKTGAVCVACGSAVEKDTVKAEAVAGRMGVTLLAVVAAGDRRRIYLPSSSEHADGANVEMPATVPDGLLSTHPQYMGAPRYGMTHWADLFTNRQLLALTTFSDLVMEARELVLADALAIGIQLGDRLESGGVDAAAYADAVATYLGIAFSRGIDRQSAVCSWDASTSKEQIRGVFARQAVPMTWDMAEANPFARSSGTWRESVDWVRRCIELSPPAENIPIVQQAAAADTHRDHLLISTDPPYYDNIPYADLSDFFYVWLRRSLREVHSDLLSTMLVPKVEELVADYIRRDGKKGAKEFFEDGFRQVFTRARATALPDFPITVYYAFKQSDSNEGGTASTGWETLLEGMMQSGWEITATWPLRSELGNRMRSQGSNALASSIVLALRPRSDDASITDRRGFIKDLRDELPGTLRAVQQGTVAPVDLPQAAIGPGMAVFSRYSKVIEDDGSPMTVRAALEQINEILDEVLNEQEGDFDSTTRFAIAWYVQNGYATGNFGEADNLARARNTSVDRMANSGILNSAAGKVGLLAPELMVPEYDVVADDSISAWEVLHHLIARLDSDGIPAAGEFLAAANGRDEDVIDPDLIKELAHLLFRIADAADRTKDAIAFNTVVTAWPEILAASRSTADQSGEQVALDLEGE